MIHPRQKPRTAVVIAEATGEEKSVKSLACLFPREGRTDQPVDLRVERSHDGRSFAARRLTAVQEGRASFLADVSLHAEDEA